MRNYTDRRFGPVELARLLALSVCTVAGVSGVSGCSELLAFLGCDRGAFLTLRGTVVDAESREPIPGVLITGRSFVGEASGEFPSWVPAEEDGTFGVFLAVAFPLPCVDLDPVFPDPEAVELLIVRDSCEQRFVVPISEETAVRTVAGGSTTFDLVNEIAVPPCQDGLETRAKAPDRE